MRLSLLLLNLNILTKTVDGSDLFKVQNVSCMYITRLTVTPPFFSLIQLVHPLRTLLSFSILGVFRWRFRVRLSILPLPSTPIHLNFFDTRHSSLTHPQQNHAPHARTNVNSTAPNHPHSQMRERVVWSRSGLVLVLILLLVYVSLPLSLRVMTLEIILMEVLTYFIYVHRIIGNLILIKWRMWLVLVGWALGRLSSFWLQSMSFFLFSSSLPLRGIYAYGASSDVILVLTISFIYRQTP